MSNRRTSNRLIPENITNIKSILGKRKRVNNRNTSNNRPPKKTNLGMIAEIGQVTNNKINIRLPRRIINELKTLNKKSSLNRWEYAGKIEIRPNLNRTMVKFNNPERFTSQKRAEISEDIFAKLQNSYISYHTHPTAYSPNDLKNNTNMNLNKPNNIRKILVTLPSAADIRSYVENYPNMQANIISDENGYYVVDLLETEGRERPVTSEVVAIMNWIREQDFMRRRYRNYEGYEYFETTLSDWKAAINREFNPFLIRMYGLSVKYYGYNDDPAIVSFART